MTPCKKANELINQYRMILMNEDTDCGYEILCTSIAIKNAKVCVDEVLQHTQMTKEAYEGYDNPHDYFQKVRDELDLL